MSAKISLRTLIWIGPPRPKRRRKRTRPTRTALAEPTGPLRLPGLTAAEFAAREAREAAEEEEYRRRFMAPRPRGAKTREA